MSLPTSDETAAVAKFLRYQALEDLLRRRAPEFAERIERPEASPLYLKIRLDRGAAVLLHWLSRLPGAWVIDDPESASSRHRVWDRDTPEEVLIDAFKARAAAWLAGVPEPSPWRWDEATESAQTELADLLRDEEFNVTSVVVANRAVAVVPETPDVITVRTVPRCDGAYVRASRGPLHVQIALKPTLGWVADVLAPDEPHWRRLDLGRLIVSQPSVMPGAPAESLNVSQLARTLAKAVTELANAKGGEPVSSPLLAGGLFPRPSSAQSSSELAPFVAAQLHAMAFGDIAVHGDPVTPLRSQAFYVVWRGGREGSLGLPALQRLYGAAAADEKPLLVVSAEHITGPARDFSGRVKAFVFRLDPRTGFLSSGNARCTEAFLTDWLEWVTFCDRTARP